MTAMVAAHLKEIPMTKAKAKRKPTSRADDRKTRSRNSVRRTSARNTAPLKPVTTAAHQQRQYAAQPTARRESKKAHLIAMLRAPDGATIEADMSSKPRLIHLIELSKACCMRLAWHSKLI